MHRIIVARVSVPDESSAVWTLASLGDKDVRISTEVFVPYESKRLVLTSSSLAGTEMVGMITRKDLESVALMLHDLGWSISVPKFKMDYGEHGKEYTALLYAFKDLDGDDDFSMAHPEFTKEVPYFFSPFEEVDDSVFEDKCDYH